MVYGDRNLGCLPTSPAFDMGQPFFDTVAFLIRAGSNHDVAHCLADFTFESTLMDASNTNPAYLSTIQRMYESFRTYAVHPTDIELSTIGLIGLCNLASSGIPLVRKLLASDSIIRPPEAEMTIGRARRERCLRRYHEVMSM